AASSAMSSPLAESTFGGSENDSAGTTAWETIRAHRHPLAAPVALETKVSDFHDWARGAAVLAIQVLVLGTAEG
ncbi:MarR family transcriptional regulator, partial [Streptomyces sp. NPDC001215]